MQVIPNSAEFAKEPIAVTCLQSDANPMTEQNHPLAPTTDPAAVQLSLDGTVRPGTASAPSPPASIPSQASGRDVTAAVIMDPSQPLPSTAAAAAAAAPEGGKKPGSESFKRTHTGLAVGADDEKFQKPSKSVHQSPVRCECRIS